MHYPSAAIFSSPVLSCTFQAGCSTFTFVRITLCYLDCVLFHHVLHLAALNMSIYMYHWIPTALVVEGWMNRNRPWALLSAQADLLCKWKKRKGSLICICAMRPWMWIENVIIVAIQEPTDSPFFLAYEHTVTQNKHNADVIYLNVVVNKNIARTTENNTYNSVQ